MKTFAIIGITLVFAIYIAIFVLLTLWAGDHSLAVLFAFWLGILYVKTLRFVQRHWKKIKKL